MNKMNMYVVHDLVAEESGPIFEAKNDLVAMRNVKQMFQDVDSNYIKDYKLICVGRLDHTTNKIEKKDYTIDIDFSIKASEVVDNE